MPKHLHYYNFSSLFNQDSPFSLYWVSEWSLLFPEQPLIKHHPFTDAGCSPALGWLCWHLPSWLVRFARITELSEGSGANWKLHETPNHKEKWSLGRDFYSSVILIPIHCWGSRSGASPVWSMKHSESTLCLSLKYFSLFQKKAMLRRAG